MLFVLFLFTTLVHCQNEVAITCPTESINVTLPFVLNPETLRSALHVQTSGPDALLTLGGGMNYRAISFDAAGGLDILGARCLFQRLSVANQSALRVGESREFTLCGDTVAAFVVEGQISTIVHSLNFGDGGGVPLSKIRPGNVGGAHTFAVQGTAELTIPIGEWTIAISSDDGQMLEFPSDSAVRFEQRIGTIAGTSNNTVGRIAAGGFDVSMGTITVTGASATTAMSFVYQNWYGGSNFALTVARGHKTAFISTDFTVLSDSVLGWRVRPNELQPLAAAEARFDCGAAGVDESKIAVHATNAQDPTNPRSSSCVVTFRTVEPALRCATDVVLAVDARGGTTLNASILVHADIANSCLSSMTVVNPMHLTCDDVGRSVSVQLVDARGQTCNTTVSLVDTRALCETSTSTSTIQDASDKYSSTSGASVSSTTITFSTSISSSSISTSTSMTNPSARLTHNSNPPWWTWVVLSLVLIFCILLVVTAIVCTLRRTSSTKNDSQAGVALGSATTAEQASFASSKSNYGKISDVVVYSGLGDEKTNYVSMMEREAHHDDVCE
jgi:hypothetical protein